MIYYYMDYMDYIIYILGLSVFIIYCSVYTIAISKDDEEIVHIDDTIHSSHIFV